MNAATGEFNFNQMVLDEIRDVKRQIAHLRNDLTMIRVDVSALKVKATIWGLIGGAIPVTGMLVFWLLRNTQ
jgi:hypothetical protein